jgi:HEAT repeat protein
MFWFVRTRIFKFRLRRIVKAQGAAQAQAAVKIFVHHYPPEKLVRYSRRMERYSRQMGPQVVRETGLADKWTQKLVSSNILRAADIRRVLLYCPSSSVFKAFLAATQHPSLRRFFKDWMNSEGEEKVIRLLSETCRGEDFDPSFGKSITENHETLLHELTGEPEWYTRYFAYRILLLDREALPERSLEGGLLDPHPLVRKIITGNFSTGREKTWAILWDKLIHDPVYEVREAARKRIGKEFMDLYSPKDAKLNDDETVRVLELLDPNCQEDRTFAMAALESLNKELCCHAAAFLEKCGALASLLAKNTFDDLNGVDRCVTLLQNAMEVNVSGFLWKYPSGDGAPLLAAARLLSGQSGVQESVCYLEEKVFAFFHNKKLDPSNKEIYIKTLEAAAANGNIKAHILLAEELSRRETHPAFLELLLPRLPGKAGTLFLPVLFRFLENTVFPLREELAKALGNFNPDMVLPEVLRILNSPRTKHPHIVRISAFKILGQMRLAFCLQKILENLPTLTPEETEEFSHLIASYYPQDMLEEKIKILLASPDAKIRASLITILPATKNESFIKEIRSSLKDIDPDVRVSAIKALLEFGEIKLLNQETSMLRDPIERVRLATAEVIARHGNTSALEILRTITTDHSETDVVKIGVITGLGQAVSAEGIPILIAILDSQPEFREYAENALTMRISKRDITQLIEIFKDAEPQLREKMIPVFKKQGKQAEPWILEILTDEVASLKPYLVKILEESGYVDEAKRRLSHRNVEVRREAANLLSLMDTLSAFRGLVLAAKDPDQEVRVCVVKALEKVKSSHSRDVLEKLKEDPDSRIRKYTFWALERMDSLAME